MYPKGKMATSAFTIIMINSVFLFIALHQYDKDYWDIVWNKRCEGYGRNAKRNNVK